MTPLRSRASALRREPYPLVLLTLFVGLAAWTWRRWADPIVDFGNEPYVSWQLLEGRSLYTDIAWLYGPISPWLNGVAFLLFGPSLTTLAVFNLSLAALLSIVVYRCWACSCDPFTAFVATFALLVGFIFPHHSEDTGNYNFVWPYAYAATHGTALLVCSLAVLSRALVTDRRSYWMSGGLLLGLTALTKTEIALSAGCTAAMAALWRITDGRPGTAGSMRALALGFLAALVGTASSFGTDAVVAPWSAVARVVGGDRSFNAHLMGTDDLAGNLSRLAVDALVWSLLTCLVIGVDLHGAGAPESRKRWSIIGCSALVGVALVRDLPGVGRALPVLIPVAAAVLTWIARRRPERRDSLVPLILWAIAGWSLLARMMLNVQLHHYGFYLALPAAVFVVVLSVGVVPRLLAERVAGGGAVARGVALVTIGLLVLYSSALSLTSNARMTVAIGRDLDAMYGPNPDASPTGLLASALLERIDSSVPRDATLAVLPDGPLLNFLSRHANPTPFHQLMPPTLVTFGVAEVLASYRAHSPDYIVLYDWSGSEYGVGSFGSKDWGGELVVWVHQHYEAMPASSSTAGIGFSLWRHRDPAAFVDR